jgi:ABC-type branched-subunit amino acid transport system ATPase component
MKLLEVRDLSKRFGGLAAVSNLNLTVEIGEIVGLIVRTAPARRPALTF